MNTHEAKKDLTGRLQKLGVPFKKLTAKTVGFEDLARGGAVFVTVHEAVFQHHNQAQEIKAGVPRPSDGGYVIQFEGCTSKV